MRCGALRHELAATDGWDVPLQTLPASSWIGLLDYRCQCRKEGLTIEGTLDAVMKIDSASGNPVYRKFCGTCGSPVFTETPGAVMSKG